MVYVAVDLTENRGLSNDFHVFHVCTCHSCIKRFATDKYFEFGRRHAYTIVQGENQKILEMKIATLATLRAVFHVCRFHLNVQTLYDSIH